MGVTVALRLSNVSKAYGARRIVRDLSLTVDGGETLAVTGENGSGKSTLLRMAAGLLRPTGGTICVIRGTESWADATDRRQLVAYAAPDMAFYPELTGLENLTFFESVRGRQGAAVASACRDALTRVGLGARGDDPVGVYSSGMRQRLRLAFTWLTDAPVLLLDEPSLALDTVGVPLVAERIAAQRERGGVTLLATNIEAEAALGDRAIVLRMGKVAE